MSEISSRAWPRSWPVPSPPSFASSAVVRFLLVPFGGFVLLATVPLWASALLFNDFDTDWTGFFLVPVLVLVSLGLAVRVSKGDLVLRWLLPVGIVLKVVAAAAQLYIFGQGSADFVSYYGAGVVLAEHFRATGHLALHQPVWSSNLVRDLAGCLFIITGPCMAAAMVLFALLGFWGQYFCYRAFLIAFPQGSRWFAGVMLFLLPSLVFWPAALGKDALIVFFIGLGVFGFAQVLRSPAARPLLVCGIGLLGTALVRPHIAAMMATGFLSAYVLGRSLSGLAGTLRKFLLVPVLLGVTFYLVSRAQSFVELEDISHAQEVLQRVARNSQRGGSAFSPGSTASSLLTAPLLLFRPYLWEVRSVQPALAALEGTVLLILLWRRRRAVLTALRTCRTNPFVIFILVYSGQVLLVFSVAITNFGLLARQRVMVIPMFLMLLAGPPSVAFALRRAPRSDLPQSS